MATSRTRIRKAKELSAGRTLRLLLDAQRVTRAAGDIQLESLTLLLALKSGPAYPEEIADALECAPGVVRQRIFRARRNAVLKRLLRTTSDGRYALTAKGHRRVNELASYAIHHILSPESVTPITLPTSPA